MSELGVCKWYKLVLDKLYDLSGTLLIGKLYCVCRLNRTFSFYIWYILLTTIVIPTHTHTHTHTVSHTHAHTHIHCFISQTVFVSISICQSIYLPIYIYYIYIYIYYIIQVNSLFPTLVVISHLR